MLEGKDLKVSYVLGRFYMGKKDFGLVFKLLFYFFFIIIIFFFCGLVCS